MGEVLFIGAISQIEGIGGWRYSPLNCCKPSLDLKVILFSEIYQGWKDSLLKIFISIFP